MAGKLWRTRGRSVLSNVVLFGLGAMTCLICLQMFASTGIDDAVVFTNSDEYRLAAQQLEGPDQKDLNHASQHQQLISVLCGSGSGGDGGSATTKQDLKKSNPRSYRELQDPNSNTVMSKSGGAELIPTHQSTNSNNNNNNIEGDIHKSSQSLTNSDLRSHQDDLKHFEGVQLSPADNNVNTNDDILSSRDIEESNFIGDGSPGPTVYVVTPTFFRPEQYAELTRVAHSLLPVSDFIHWIIIEDVSKGTDKSFDSLKTFLQRFPLTTTVLKSLPAKSRIVGRPRGVGGRTAAINWLRENAQEGVVYFCDDDNTYDHRIFKQMQSTEKVSMWPVGLVTDLGVSSPIVKNGRVVGFYDGWNGQRKFPVDMAGFAVNLQLFLDNPKASMPWKAGYEEDELLQSLGITMKDIKPLANNCTEIFVWHTKAVKNVWPKRPKNLLPSVASNTNLHALLSQLPQKTPVSPVESQNQSETGFSFLRMIFGNNV